MKVLKLIAASVLLFATGVTSFALTGVVTNAFNLAQVGGVIISLGQKAMSASVPVVIASDQGAVTITGSVTATTTPPQSNGVPLRIRVGCTTGSGTLIAANANRIGVECDSDINNTDRVYVHWGTDAATSSDKRLEIGASWQPPVASSGAVTCLSASGTQNVSCYEYNK